MLNTITWSVETLSVTNFPVFSFEGTPQALDSINNKTIITFILGLSLKAPKLPTGLSQSNSKRCSEQSPLFLINTTGSYRYFSTFSTHWKIISNKIKSYQEKHGTSKEKSVDVQKNCY